VTENRRLRIASATRWGNIEKEWKRALSSAKQLKSCGGIKRGYYNGPKYADMLKQTGIGNTGQPLAAGAGPQGRKLLAERSGIDESLILKWVNMSDLFRIKKVLRGSIPSCWKLPAWIRSRNCVTATRKT
jgi:hypothetical protein